MVGSSLSFTHCIVFELYTAPPLTIHTTLWGHWFCADSILNSWKVICYVGCETLGWWNWHEEARGSSKIYWDGRVAFWCMYVLIGILYMFWTLPTVFILINFIKYLNYKIQYTVICKCLKCCSLVFDSFTIMFALLSRFFFSRFWFWFLFVSWPNLFLSGTVSRNCSFCRRSYWGTSHSRAHQWICPIKFVSIFSGFFSPSNSKGLVLYLVITRMHIFVIWFYILF